MDQSSDSVSDQKRASQFGIKVFTQPRPKGEVCRPGGSKHWSLVTLFEKLIKIGAKVIGHSRYITVQMA